MCSGYSVFTEGGYKSQFKNVTYNYSRSDYFANFIRSSTEEKKDWEPLKQGLFDGEYLKYHELYVELEKSHLIQCQLVQRMKNLRRNNII